MPYCPNCNKESNNDSLTCDNCQQPLLSTTPSDAAELIPRSKVYVNKEQKYDNYKSSAAAFLLVGVILVVFIILSLIKVIELPMTGFSSIIFHLVMAMMVIFCCFTYYSTIREANRIAPEIERERIQTQELIKWFSSIYTSVQIDQQIANELGILDTDELILKRYEMIQDYLITSHDLADQTYVEMLTEEIYIILYD